MFLIIVIAYRKTSLAHPLCGFVFLKNFVCTNLKANLFFVKKCSLQKFYLTFSCTHQIYFYFLGSSHLSFFQYFLLL